MRRSARHAIEYAAPVDQGTRPRGVAHSTDRLAVPSWSMAAVLLTGASGFVGIHVLRQLLDQVHEVRAFVRTPDKLRRNLLLVEVDADDPRLEPIQGDMTDTHALREAAAGCERAIHTAA